MNRLIILTLIFLLLGCSKNNGEKKSSTILLLKVDYTSYNFEGGFEKVISEAITPADTIPVSVDYIPPGDFGNISLYYQPTNELLFDGSIIWNGTGQISYPASFNPPAAYTLLPSPVAKPDDSRFQIIFYNLKGQAIDYAGIWNGISSLEIVSDYLQSPKKIGLFLYTPSVGVGDPNTWDWFLIFNK